MPFVHSFIRSFVLLPVAMAAAVSRQAAQEEERRLVARVVHLMRNEDTDCYFRMLVVARRHLGQVSPVAVVVSHGFVHA